MELEHLDQDNLMSIFDWMDFDGWLYMAESNPQFYQLIMDNYIIEACGFNEKKIHLTNIKSTSSVAIRIEPNEIFLEDFDLILRVIRSFGHIISRLVFNSATFNSDQVKIIGKYIDKYCSPSLREFILSDGITSPFSNWQNAFERCESMEFQNLINHNQLSLKRTFPRLHRLFIKTTKSSNLSFLEHNLPHLQHITLDLNEPTSNAMRSALKNFLFSNNQLRLFEMQSPVSATFLSFVNTALTQLHSLVLTIQPSDYSSHELDDKLNFATVATLKLRVIGGDIMFSHFPITFDRLRSLHLSCDVFDINAMKFVTQNKHLISLIIDDDTLDYTRWLRLIDSLPELTEITATVRQTFLDSDADNTTLMTHKHLQRFTIGLNHLSDQQTWIKSMPKIWKLIDTATIERQQLIFVRDWSADKVLSD